MTAITMIFSCPESRVLEIATTDGESTYTLTDIKDHSKLSYRAVKRVVNKFLTLRVMIPERRLGNTVIYRFNIDLVGGLLREAKALGTLIEL